MKWILIIMMINGGVSVVPMDNQQACEYAKAQVRHSSLGAIAVCVTQN